MLEQLYKVVLEWAAVKSDENNGVFLDRRLSAVLNQLDVAFTFDLYDYLLQDLRWRNVCT